MTAQDGTFSTSDGCKISYTLRSASGGRAPKLALIHSLALDRSVWDGVVEHIGDRAEILTYDARGHGRSDHPHMPYSSELFARDLAELMDHIGWSKAMVAGCSMGGCVAQAFGGLYPARAQALALIDTSAWYGPEGPKNFRDRAAAGKAKGMAALIGFQVTRWFSDKFPPAHPDVVKKFTDVFVANDVECYGSTCVLLGDADLRHYLPAFKMPVAVIVGEEDYAAPVAMAKLIHEAVAGSSLHIIPGGRHLTPIENPDEIAKDIVTLLGRI